jgi:hypothetical protein
MATLLVTYDLNKEAKRPNITKALKEAFPAWAMLSESSYVIATSLGPQAAYNTLAPLFDENDTLYVITLKRPYFGYGPEEVNGWLENNLTW